MQPEVKARRRGKARARGKGKEKEKTRSLAASSMSALGLLPPICALILASIVGIEHAPFYPENDGEAKGH